MAQKTQKVNAGGPVNPDPMVGSTPLDDAAPRPTMAAMRLSDVLKTMTSTTTLSEAGQAYIERIDKRLVEHKTAIRSYPISTTRAEGRAFVDEQSKFAITLILSETYAAMDSNSIAEQYVDFSNMLINSRSDAKLLQTIVVDPEDYVLADNMAAFIINAIKSCTSSESMTVASLQGERLSVITNRQAVEEWVAKNSPHKIPARNDIGVLICIDTPTGNMNRFNQPEMDQQPFMAITGYTRIISPEDSGAGKYIPVATITDIISKFPNQNLMSLAISVAADAFIMQSLWSRPYVNFGKDQPNLGNLFSDTKTGVPFAISNPDEFHRFVNDSLLRPYLAVDITEGRARPVGIDLLLFQERRPEFIANLSHFLNGTFGPEVMGQDLAVWMCRNFTGTYLENGIVKDTRWVDFLRLAPKMANNLQKIRPLLRQPNNPEGRIEQVRDIFTDGVKNLYTTTTIVLQSKLIVGIAMLLNANGIKLNYDTPTSGVYSVAPLMNSQANDFSGFVQMNRVMGGNFTYGTNRSSVYVI